MQLRAAFIKTSLIDFPGRVSSVLFLPGCDFRCPYCHNAALVRGSGEAGDDPDDGLLPIEDFYAMLDARKRLISGAVISGGEPLLYEGTPAIAEAIRKRGLAVKLDTNGSFPDRISLVAPDYVALDIKAAPGRYASVAPALPEAGKRLLESLSRLRSSGTPFELRITCAPGVVEEEDIREIAELLEADDRVFLQQFRPGDCLDPAWNSLEPYSRPVLQSFLAILKARAPSAKLRGA